VPWIRKKFPILDGILGATVPRAQQQRSRHARASLVHAKVDTGVTFMPGRQPSRHLQRQRLLRAFEQDHALARGALDAANRKPRAS
jgi:hypothetical protein